jgi:hypothetical protein
MRVLPGNIGPDEAEIRQRKDFGSIVPGISGKINAIQE